MQPEIWAYRILRWGLAGIFLVAGAEKMLRPEALALIVADYGLLPPSWGMPAAVVLSVVEVVAAVGLVFDIRGSLTLITGLLVLFAALLGYGIWLGLDVDCGCFGPSELEGDLYHDLRPALYRDLAMIGGAASLYYWRLKGLASPARVSRLLRRGAGMASKEGDE